MFLKQRKSFIPLALLAAGLLSACGGGSGSSSTAGGGATTVGGGGTGTGGGGTGGTGGGSNAGSGSGGTLQTSVAAPTYGNGSAQLSAYQAINTARQSYGVGLMAQNALLDTAGTNHSNYILTQWQAGNFTGGHGEDASKAGFTGATPFDRMAYVQYHFSSAGEVYAMFGGSANFADPGAIAVNMWLSGPYHRFGVLDGNREMGVGVASGNFPSQGGVQYFFTVDMGTATGVSVQAPASNWVGMWPVNQSSAVPYSFSGESPNPIPANNGACAGYPVSLQVASGLTLSVSSFVLTDLSTNNAVRTQLSTPTTDANPTYARSNTAYLIAYTPLKLNTRYGVHFAGSAGGQSVNADWSFTTTATRDVFGCVPGN